MKKYVFVLSSQELHDVSNVDAKEIAEGQQILKSQGLHTWLIYFN